MIFGKKRHQRLLLLMMTSLLIATMSGVFVAGVGSAIWWFLSPLAVLVPYGLYATRQQGSSPRARLQPYERQTNYWRSTILLLGICFTAALSWLVLHQRPLPMLDFGTAALFTVLFALLSMVLVLVILRLPLLSFPSLFLGTTFLFTCSPLILYQTEGYDAFRWWRLVELESILQGMPAVMLAFSSFLVGAFAAVAMSNGQNTTPATYRLSQPHGETLRAIGLGLYWTAMLLIIVFTLRGSALSLAYDGGYHDFAGSRRVGEMSRLVTASLSWLLPWSLLILISTCRSRRAYVQTLLMALPAITVMLMAGARAAPLGVMLLMGSGAHILGLHIDWKRSLVIVLLVMLLVPTIVNLRSVPIREWSTEVIIQAVTNQVQGSRSYELSPVEATLVSGSTSYQTLMGTMLLVPDVEPHRFGLDYLRALGTAIPFGHLLFSKVGIDLSEAEPSDWLKSRISPTRWSGLGYLQLAEAYLQFGAYGVVGLYLILGVLVTHLWRRMEHGPLDPRFLSLILIVMMSLLIWIRNEIVALMRPLVWGWLLIYMLPELISLLQRRERSHRSVVHPHKDAQA